MTDYEYLTLVYRGESASGKTQIWAVHAKRGGELLGEIRWFGRWRQYTFIPEPNTIFSKGCLEDIADIVGRVKTTAQEDHERLQHDRGDDDERGRGRPDADRDDA